MQPPALAPEVFVEQVLAIDAALDDVVNHGSDDDLFIASYLQGHYAVIARKLEMSADACLDLLDHDMTMSLQDAFDNKEVDETDADKIQLLWARLLDQVR